MVNAGAGVWTGVNYAEKNTAYILKISNIIYINKKINALQHLNFYSVTYSSNLCFC